MPLRRHHFWFFLSFIFLCALIAYVFLSISRLPEAPTTLRERLRVDGPVGSPEVSSLEELGEYTAGKPVPPPSDINIGAYDTDEHIRGKKDSPITILEYSDLSNNYARLMQPGLKEFIDENEDVNWVFRHYYFGETDNMIARASECIASELGEEAFWQFADAVLANSVETKEDIVDQAVKVGSDPEITRWCLNTEGIYRYEVGLDALRAQAIGEVFMTPMFFIINNMTGETRRLPGADTIKYIAKVVDEVR